MVLGKLFSTKICHTKVAVTIIELAFSIHVIGTIGHETKPLFDHRYQKYLTQPIELSIILLHNHLRISRLNLHAAECAQHE